MHNTLVCKDVCKRMHDILCTVFILFTSLLEILDSDIIIKTINNEKIIYNYEIIISLISLIFHSIAFISFIISILNIFHRILS